jgi:tetratricopeptide (TPR) repeat protein
MKILLATALAALTFGAAQAGEQPVRQMLYNVDSVRLCSAAANGQADFKDGLAACNTALRDPLAMHRAALLMDRGVIQVKLGDNEAALADYDGAIALDDRLDDAYVNRAGMLVAMHRYRDAGADVARAIALGASNLHIAYYDRAVIEEETGNIPAAYRDYKQALALKPDFAAASRELARFKVLQPSAG